MVLIEYFSKNHKKLHKVMSSKANTWVIKFLKVIYLFENSSLVTNKEIKHMNIIYAN